MEVLSSSTLAVGGDAATKWAGSDALERRQRESTVDYLHTKDDPTCHWQTVAPRNKWTK